jgi:hypothetical protein
VTQIPFPIQIGLTGAPGSGKSLVAEKFQEISRDWIAENQSELYIIPNMGNVIEQSFDIAMGPNGAWIDDQRAYWNRFEAEQAARAAGVSWISVGTGLDNIAHCGINLELIMTGLQTPDQEVRMQRQQVTMTALTFQFLEQFRYLFGFYVPYVTSSIILPGQETSPEEAYSTKIDMALRTIFANFGIRIQALEGTPDQQAASMFETVQRIMEQGPEIPEEQPEQEPIDVVAGVSDIEGEFEDVPDTEAATVSE